MSRKLSNSVDGSSKKKPSSNKSKNGKSVGNIRGGTLEDECPSAESASDSDEELGAKRRRSIYLGNESDNTEVIVGKYDLISAATENDWLQVDGMLRQMKRRDKRINVGDPKTGMSTLMIACQQSRFLIVDKLLTLGAEVNMRSYDRQTALHYAAKGSHEEIVKTLLLWHADPNLLGGENCELPLHIAASRGRSGFVVAMLLLRASLKEARVVKDHQSKYPITNAVLSGFTSLVKEMLQCYAEEQVQWCNEITGEYLVHLAARKKLPEIMAVLVNDGGANVNVQDKEGQTCLHVATKRGDMVMTKLLYTLKADPDIWDKTERSPLHVASESGQTEIVDLLIERFKANVYLRTKDGSTLMHLASERGYPDTVYSFIKQGVPLNMPNKAGTLCIHLAAQHGHLSVVNALIRKGSHIDMRTKEGYTALHLAVLNNQPAVIQALLGHGAKVDLKGGALKEAPLHIVAKMQNGFQCAEMLIKSGAIIDIITEENWETPLHVSARYGSVDLLKMLLEEGANAMQLSKSGETALHIAIRHCHFDVVNAIISFVNNHTKGKDASNIVNLASHEGETAFHLAAELAKSQTHHPFEEIDIIRLLLENGADPMALTALTHETSLHYCARSGNPDILTEIVRHLGSSFQMACNRQDRMGWSPLMTACEQGHKTAASIFLANGARADVFDEHGKAALHLAAENGHRQSCELLLSYKAFVNSKSKLGISPLHFAAQGGHTTLVKLLIEKYHAILNALSLEKKTPLHSAAEAGRKDVCLLLMNMKADANAVDSEGQNPLHLAAENDHSDVVKLFMKNKPDLVTAASKSGMTCAHIAANNGSETVIKDLLQFNRSLVTSVKNQVNESLPLHLAVDASHEDVVKILIDAGSSAIAENQQGMTAIHLAAKEGDMEVLEAIIASSPISSLGKNSAKNGLSPLHVAAFYGKSEIIRELQTRIDINGTTDLPQMANVVGDQQLRALINMDHGLTALHCAAYMGRENAVRLILNNSSVLTDLTSFHGRVPMFYACLNGHLVTVSLLMSRSPKHLQAKDKKDRTPLHLTAENGHKDLVATLLGLGAEINSADDEGWTPLHFATKNGHVDTVKLIIESGASPTLKTTDGRTPLMIAAHQQHIDLIDFLMNREHDSLELMNDNNFLMDLMLCGRVNDNESVNEFILHSPAPLYTVTLLTKLYRELAFKEKERAKDINELARYCEHMATKVLGIACDLASPSVVLRGTDSKGNQYLDMLLEYSMKEVIEHPSVQRYLSDVWSGSVNTWSATKLFLLFMGFMLFPPLLIYFCLPFKHHNYHHTPIIKFLAMVVSNFYLIGLLSVVAAVPLNPNIYRSNFYPDLVEVILCAWIGGMIEIELTKSGTSSGLNMLRHIIIFFASIASVFQMAAIGLQDTNREQALLMMYIRNVMLSFSLFASITLIVDFFMIHYLFGPLGIIIASVIRDLVVFIVVLFLFLIAFTFQICCLFQSLKLPTNDVSGNVTTTNFSNVTEPLPQLNITVGTIDQNLTDQSDYFAGTINTDRFVNGSFEWWNGTLRQCKPPKSKKELTANLKVLRQQASGGGGFLIRQKRGIGRGGGSRHLHRRPLKPKKSGSGSFWTSADDGNASNKSTNYKPPAITNNDPLSLIILFVTLYFAMFAMGGPDILPVTKGGPSWSPIVFQIMFGVWMIISFIVLIPLLIAMLTETYKKIHMRSDLEWKFGRAKLIRSMVKMSAPPSPINIFVRPFFFLYSVKKHGRMMCTAYWRYLAEEDEHEGADAALFSTDSDKPKKDSIFTRFKNLILCRKKGKVVHAAAADATEGAAPADSNTLNEEEKMAKFSVRPMEEVVDWWKVVENFRDMERERAASQM